MDASAPGKQTGFFEGLSGVVTALLGLAGLVYVSGAAVLWIRLWAIDVPANPVVTGLPRELLIGTGLRTVVLPSLALASFALAGFGVAAFSARFSGSGWWIATLIFAAIIFAFGIVAWLAPTSWAFWTLGTYFALGAGYLAFNLMRGHLSEASGFAIVALVLLAVGVVGAGVRVALELENHGLPRTVVCVNDGGKPYLGFLIGETSGAVYVGQRKRVVEIPKDRIGEIYIGPALTPCTVPKPPMPPG